MHSPLRFLLAQLALSLSLVHAGCGTPQGDADTGTDAGGMDADPAPDASERPDTPALDAIMVDAGATDTSMLDAGEADTGEVDVGALDAGAPDVGALDAGTPDAGTPDAGTPDAGTPDAGTPDAGTDAGFSLPGSCAASSECGPSASCVTSHCVCNGGSLPCGSSCCAFTYVRDVALAPTGHAPELGSDALGNVYVLYHVGSSSVRLATLAAGASTASTEVITTSSGNDDDADLAVAPDGTVMIAVHRAGAGRSGRLSLYTRAPAASTFTVTELVPPAADVFAYDAAVSIARAPGGDVYAAASARLGDGTTGLAMARYPASTGAWVGLPTVLGASAYGRSELFARDDGFDVGVYDFPNTQSYFQRLDAAGTSVRFLGLGLGSGRAVAGAAMDDGGVLSLFTHLSFDTGELVRSDGSIDEAVTFTGNARGSRSELDMALDDDDNPVLIVHSVTHHAIVVMVRMPLGGYASFTWFEASFLPSATTSTWMTLDAERLPSGNLAFVIGDSMDRGPLQLREIAR